MTPLFICLPHSFFLSWIFLHKFFPSVLFLTESFCFSPWCFHDSFFIFKNFNFPTNVMVFDFFVYFLFPTIFSFLTYCIINPWRLSFVYFRLSLSILFSVIRCVFSFASLGSALHTFKRISIPQSFFSKYSQAFSHGSSHSFYSIFFPTFLRLRDPLIFITVSFVIPSSVR